MSMLDKKSIQLINTLINEEEVNLTKLMRKTTLSKKQILYSVDYINTFLSDNEKKELDVFQRNIILSPENKEFFIDCLLNGYLFNDYFLDAEERIKYIFFLLFNKGNSYLSISDFLTSLNVSKSTIIADIKKLQIELGNYTISIDNDRNVGYFLSGDEHQIRYLAMKYILEDLSSETGTFFYDYFFFNEQIDDLKKIKETFLYYSIQKYDISFTDRQLTEISYTLGIFLKRLEDSSKNEGLSDFAILQTSREYEISSDILSALSKVPNVEAIGFLTSWILTFTTVQIGEDTFDRHIIFELVDKVIRRFELLSGIEFYNRKEVENKLYSHFRAVHYRMLYKIPILNIFLSRVKTQYADLFEIVGLSLKVIEDCYDHPIPDEEVAYLTMHFIVAIEDYGIKHDGKRIAAVVCQNGIGSSALIFQQLKLLFPDFRFIGPYDKNSLLSETSRIDMIFSTEPNLDLYDINQDIFIVNPVMSAEERYNLFRKVYSKFGISKVRFPRVTDLIAIINKNNDVKDVDQLRRELYAYLLAPETDEISEPCEVSPTLSDLLKVENIQTDVKILNYEEGIKIAAEPLLDRDIIQESYLNQLLVDYNDGKLMQLTDLFCMPHTSDTGGNQLGMSLVVLDEPFLVNNQVKVKYILLLSAPKSSIHLLAMNQLLKFLSSQDFFETLNHCSPKEIHKYILENQ